MKRPRLQYVAAGAIGVVGLIVAAVIAVAAVLASGNIPTAPSSYEIQVVRVADTGPRFAPYVDVGLYPPYDLTATAEKTGVSTFTLAFITSGGGCTPKWGGTTDLDANPVANQAAALRAAGGDIRISFGGASGSELGTACTGVESLTAAYDKVVTAFGLTQADFDIEGAALPDTEADTRRAKAIAALQRKHSGLKVSFTLPVLPTGLTPDGVNLVSNAKANGVAIDAVNIMAMDYGPPSSAMGDLAIQAATSTETQLRAALDVTSAWNRLAVTPMIGVNDVATETFTPRDAAQVAEFAASKGLAWTAMWSANRDRPCPGGPKPQADPTCSGIARQPFAFTEAFA
ncbi:chitinase [Actinomadura bangladeshensis]|uniref:Chitinase n=1 Tax=Actinomadura bangladeshensis TaxID=453573 RepID=A0A6L9QWA9_9ACTN|nr:chitinase [Actinomadura bangladeshensis]NEA29242.1 chitinase [Actinomadura bangladeshensis]